MELYSPAAAAFAKSGNQNTLDMWQRGWFCENDTFEVGYHAFRCPLVAICADTMTTEGAYVNVEFLDGATKQRVERLFADGSKFLIGDPGPDGTKFIGHFPMRTYDEWINWTEAKEAFKMVSCKDTDHMSIKANRRFKETIYNALRDLLKRW